VLVNPKTVQGELRFDKVNFHYQMRPDNNVLQDVDLVIEPGSVCALVGKSGGGKSTIVHLFMRFYDPTTGRVLLDGRDITELNLKSLHDHMGLVSQDTQLFANSVEENIAYGVTSYTKEELYEAAQLANAHEFIMGFEEGYATKVGERGVRLSGGQKQRIAIARCFLRRPKMLFLDEATSSLDTESEALVQEAIDKLIKRGGCTVLLVAHRLSTVVNADKIAVVDKGRIVEQGKHDELLNRGGIYARLIRRQIMKHQNQLEQDNIPDSLEGKALKKAKQKKEKEKEKEKKSF